MTKMRKKKHIRKMSLRDILLSLNLPLQSNLSLKPRKNPMAMLRYKSLIFLALMSVLGSAFAEITVENEFDAVFRAFKEKRDGIGSLTAHFTQRTVLPDEVI